MSHFRMRQAGGGCLSPAAHTGVRRISVVGCQQPRLDRLRRGDGPSSRLERSGYPSCSRSLCHRFAHLLTQAIGIQAFGGQAGPGIGDLDAAGDFQLVPAEWNGANRNAARQGLLGRAHSAVRHRANGAIEQRPVGKEPLHACIGGNPEPRRVTGRQGRHDENRLGRQRLEGRW